MLYKLRTDLNFGAYTILISYCDSKIYLHGIDLKRAKKERTDRTITCKKKNRWFQHPLCGNGTD